MKLLSVIVPVALLSPTASRASWYVSSPSFLKLYPAARSLVAHVSAALPDWTEIVSPEFRISFNDLVSVLRATSSWKTG
jgi:hypothetical protein